MTDVLEEDVKDIRHKVYAIEKAVDLLVRANRKEIVSDLMALFGKSTVRARVFLAVDGERSVGQIASGLDLRIEQVSRQLSELEREGLVRVRSIQGTARVYEKTEKVGLLGLERELQRLLDQNPRTKPAGESEVTDNANQGLTDHI